MPRRAVETIPRRRFMAQAGGALLGLGAIGAAGTALPIHPASAADLPELTSAPEALRR
jgi:hypothetical protein